MSDNILADVAEELNFKQDERSIWGKLDSYWFRVEVLKKNLEGKDLYGINTSVTHHVALNKFLNSLKEEGLIYYYGYDKNLLFLEINDPASTKDSLISLLKKITDYFNSVKIESVCTLCAKTKGVNLGKLNNEVFNICTECFDNIENPQEATTGHEKYLTGILGAFLGGIICSVGWILLGALGFYASIGGYLIAYGAFWGYKKLKGPQTKVSIAIVVIAILGSVLFAEAMGLAIQIVKEFDSVSIPEAFLLIPLVLEQDGVLISLVPNFFIGLLFAGLGSYRLIKENLAETEPVSIEIKRV